MESVIVFAKVLKMMLLLHPKAVFIYANYGASPQIAPYQSTNQQQHATADGYDQHIRQKQPPVKPTGLSTEEFIDTYLPEFTIPYHHYVQPKTWPSHRHPDYYQAPQPGNVQQHAITQNVASGYNDQLIHHDPVADVNTYQPNNAQTVAHGDQYEHASHANIAQGYDSYPSQPVAHQYDLYDSNNPPVAQQYNQHSASATPVAQGYNNQIAHSPVAHRLAGYLLGSHQEIAEPFSYIAGSHYPPINAQPAADGYSEPASLPTSYLQNQLYNVDGYGNAGQIYGEQQPYSENVPYGYNAQPQNIYPATHATVAQYANPKPSPNDYVVLQPPSLPVHSSNVQSVKYPKELSSSNGYVALQQQSKHAQSGYSRNHLPANHYQQQLPCADALSVCPLLIGQCQPYLVYMTLNCRRSCGLCGHRFVETAAAPSADIPILVVLQDALPPGLSLNASILGPFNIPLRNG